MPIYPEIEVPILGEDGNAFFIISRARRMAKRGGLDDAEIKKFQDEAESGDYANVLNTVMRWFSTS